MAVFEQVVDVFLNNRGLVNPVVALTAGNWGGGSGINAEFEAKHGTRGAFGIKGVPVGVDDVKEFGFEVGV